MNELIVNIKNEPVKEINKNVDRSWKGVYKVGGIGLFIVGLCTIFGEILSIIIGPPPSESEAYLISVAEHALISQINFGLFVVGDFLLLFVVVALYLTLKNVSKNAMLIATELMIAYIFIDLAVTEMNSLTLVLLTQQYASATTDSARAAYLAAAFYALATLPLATFFSYFISCIAFLIINIVMLKGVFKKWIALLGIVFSIEGIFASLYVVVPIFAILLGPCLITYSIWSLIMGVNLYKLGKS